MVTGDVGVWMPGALDGRLGEEGHGERDDAENDEGVEQVVLDGVPPWPELSYNIFVKLLQSNSLLN